MVDRCVGAPKGEGGSFEGPAARVSMAFPVDHPALHRGLRAGRQRSRGLRPGLPELQWSPSPGCGSVGSGSGERGQLSTPLGPCSPGGEQVWGCGAQGQQQGTEQALHTLRPFH